MKDNTSSSFTNLLDLLTPSERRRAFLILSLILVMALLDMIGVASILPFMALLANPQLLETHSLLSGIFHSLNAFGMVTTQQFLFAMGVLVFLFLITSLAFKAFVNYMQTRFFLQCEYSISKRLVEGYLQHPYSWFLNRNSADLGKTILSDVSAVTGGSLVNLFTVISQSAVILALLVLLLIVDWLLALSVGAVLILAYGTIFVLISKWLRRLGEAHTIANRERFTIVSEAFGAVKEVKLSGLEYVFIERFAAPAKIYASGRAKVQLIAQLPRYALEAIAFGGMLIILLYLMTRNGSFAAALPIFTLYAFAAYRLLPALQQLYGAFTQLRFSGPMFNALRGDLLGLRSRDAQQAKITPMSLIKNIALNNVMYRYPNAGSYALKGINLTIPAKSIIGFVGSTGSGKTTTLDVILGLLEPQAGTLTVDGQVISCANRRQWQHAIGYVPQQIYLADDTVIANIAYGVNAQEIDHSMIERAAKISNLHDFVINELPEGYRTKVGERGVRLSGGQRQRIGIARAIYHNPKVLILDEATSALDNLTEQAVMEAIDNLGHEITIIIVAHRLSTVRQCDYIYILEKGQIQDGGTYMDLIDSNQKFKAMVDYGATDKNRA